MQGALLDSNLILYDWLSFTTTAHDIQSIFDFLGIYNVKFVDMYGMRGFKDRLYFEGISVHYNSSRFDGVWVEMSGQGCRTFETISKYSFADLFSYFCAYPNYYHVTRLDVAFDDHTGIIDLQKVAADVDAQNFVSKYHNDSITYTCASGRRGYTIDCGSRKSDIKFRIYDKAFERRYREADAPHWVRFEIQMRDDHAFSFIQSVMSQSVGSLFAGVVTNYIRFVTPKRGDSNKRRWSLRKYWADLVSGAEACRLYTPCKSDYNLAKCAKWVYGTAGNGIATLITVDGVQKFLDDLSKNKPPMSAKYKSLINSNKCIESDPILDYIADMESKNKPPMSAKYKSLINSNKCIESDPILDYIADMESKYNDK